MEKQVIFMSCALGYLGNVAKRFGKALVWPVAYVIASYIMGLFIVIGFNLQVASYLTPEEILQSKLVLALGIGAFAVPTLALILGCLYVAIDAVVDAVKRDYRFYKTEKCKTVNQR